VAGGLPSVNPLAATGMVDGLTSMATGTVTNTLSLPLNDVFNVLHGLGGLGLGGGSLLSVNVAGNTNVSANVLGANVAVTGVASAASGLAGTAADLPGTLVDTAVQTAGPIVNTAVNTAFNAVDLATGLPGYVLGGAGNGLLLGGLGILNGGASVSGNANVIASLVSGL
jgi:hypothetical protein